MKAMRMSHQIKNTGLCVWPMGNVRNQMWIVIVTDVVVIVVVVVTVAIVDCVVIVPVAQLW